MVAIQVTVAWGQREEREVLNGTWATFTLHRSEVGAPDLCVLIKCTCTSASVKFVFVNKSNWCLG